jgi:hypothetical protein
MHSPDNPAETGVPLASGWAFLESPVLARIVDLLRLEDALVARLTCRSWLQAFNSRGSTLELAFPYRSEAITGRAHLSLGIRKVRRLQICEKVIRGQQGRQAEYIGLETQSACSISPASKAEPCTLWYKLTYPTSWLMM